MEKLLHEAASNRSRGVTKWYTLTHAAKCGRCGRFLASLQAVGDKLRATREVETPTEIIERLREKVGKLL
jgi:hypothetical protein